MKRQIRINTFETNSSSTHSLCICKKEEFEAWKDGKLCYDKWNCKFVKNNEIYTEDIKQEVIDYYNTKKQEHWKEWDDLSTLQKRKFVNEYLRIYNYKNNNYIVSYEEYVNDDYLEFYSEYYTSEHGDELVVFGCYGYEG